MGSVKRWVMCLNEDTPLFDVYTKLIKVAVSSCLQNTDLAPSFIYDGKPNELTRWLNKRNVEIIQHRSLFFNRISNANFDKIKLSIAKGAFLRVDIPIIAETEGWTDRFIFYTDCDVIFINHWKEEFSGINCKYFSVAPEFDIKNFNDFNTGAMLMNIRNLFEIKEEFESFITSNLDICLAQAFDQTAYQLFFRKVFDKLEPIYNWKTYWGRNENAKLIHFHGIKPHHRNAIAEGNLKEPFKSLLHHDFHYYSNLWDSYLEK
jgi:lipopolysaccharide biosynthesis glycosyltransferase